MVENKKKVSSKKIKIWAGIIFCVIFIGLIFFLFSGDNAVVLKEIFKKDVTKEEVHQSLSSLGWKGYLTIGILSMFQVILAFLPAEPVQVMGGVSFGFLKGSLVCFAGVVVGNTIIYILYKIYGQKLRDFFEDNGDFDFESAKKSSIIPLIVFVLYFLPAIFTLEVRLMVWM